MTELKLIKTIDEFQAEYRKTRCNTCHVKGKKKHIVNAYGWRLSQLIVDNAKDRIDAARENGTEAKKAEQAKVLEEFVAALRKVEEMEAPSGEKYGELFAAHVLPTAEGEKSLRE